MTTDTWLALSAGATFLLALAAFWAIWQNYSFRKKDRKRLIKERALTKVRNWVHDSLELIGLNSQYADEYQREDFDFGRRTLEKIQNAKAELVRESEEVLNSAKLFGPDFFSLVDEGFGTVQKFIEQGMAENPNIDEQYKKSFGLQFVNILKAAREIEDRELNFRA